jgi:glutamate-1-semialdehyde 2,1-aminomutase
VESLDKVRFTNSGTEATMAALRLARAFTGQSVVVRFAGSYHGTHDYTTTPGAGVPPEVDALVLTARFNDLDSVAEIFRTARQVIAAVIVEPVLGAGGVIPAEPRFLEGLRELTADHGALLIFDEVISFRLHRGGAQARYDVAPDLTTLGKIIGGGFPIGAFGGRDDVMALLDPDAGVISWGGTFNGNPVSAAAGVAALTELTEDVIEGLNASGETLVESVNDALRADGLPVHVTGVGSLFNIHTRSDPITDGSAAMIVDRELLAALHLGLMNRGFFLAPRGLGSISTPMTQLEIRGLAGSIVDLTTALLAGT